MAVTFPGPDRDVATFPGPDRGRAVFPGPDTGYADFPPYPTASFADAVTLIDISSSMSVAGVSVDAAVETVVDIESTIAVLGGAHAETLIDIGSSIDARASVAVEAATVVDIASTVDVEVAASAELLTVIDVESTTTMDAVVSVATETIVDIESTGHLSGGVTESETIVDIESTAELVPSVGVAAETVVDVASSIRLEVPVAEATGETVVDITSSMSVTGVSAAAAAQTTVDIESTATAVAVPYIPTFVGATSAGGASVSSFTCDLPEGTAAGDVLVLVVRGFLAAMSAVPAGWTQQVVNTSRSSTSPLYLLTKVAGEGEGPVTVNFNWANHHLGHLLAFRGVSPTNPIGASTTAYRSSSSSSNVSPTITPTNPNSFILRVLGCGRESAGASFTWPAGQTELTDTVVGASLAYDHITTGGTLAATTAATGTVTVTSSSSMSYALSIVVALNPAGVA